MRLLVFGRTLPCRPAARFIAFTMDIKYYIMTLCRQCRWHQQGPYGKSGNDHDWIHRLSRQGVARWQRNGRNSGVADRSRDSVADNANAQPRGTLKIHRKPQISAAQLWPQCGYINRNFAKVFIYKDIFIQSEDARTSGPPGSAPKEFIENLSRWRAKLTAMHPCTQPAPHQIVQGPALMETGRRFYRSM
jgi:hypothetical protein